MAGSRLERFGTVYTRVRDLMRSGVVKQADRPVWFDVYEAFPPKRTPLYVKPHPWTPAKKQDPVPEIFYSEDQIRAKFYKKYWTGSRPLDLTKTNFVSVCQRFVVKYEALKVSSDLDDDALFEETGKVLLAEGVVLTQKGKTTTAAEPRDPVLDLKLKEMLAEQIVNAETEEKPTEPMP
ncbi:small ribosomal subunit protein mS23 isoform X2 [Sphaeramia orbicularis]|uniref:small ribosomal subunit protein mS23 isoform X2 n=1 Tax=Sphaeramia orbicularis TaxID=375764 RepID=UPI00117EFB72|nr:28S ribosomal protein S23, mitochondrial isoform X2 [Sphaeramia orbicularis]